MREARARWRPDGYRSLAALVVAAVLASACGGSESEDGSEAADGGPGETFTITLATPLAEEGTMNGTNWWAEEVERRSDGRLQVDIFYGGSLVGPVDLLPAIRDGRVSGGWLSDPYWPTEFPRWQIVGIPFETTDAGALNRTWQELYETHDGFRSEFEDAGVHVLHFVPYSATMIGTGGDVDGPDDLVGLRLRAVGYIASALQAAGAEPAAVDATEMYESIQRGVLDGYAGYPFDTVLEFGLHEVAPITVDIGMGHYASSAIGIDLELWNSLPQDLQDLMTEVSAELTDGRAIEELVALEDASCTRYEAEGATLVRWDDEATAEFETTLGDQVREQWRADAIDRGVPEDEVDEFYETFHRTYERHLAASTYGSPVDRCLAAS